GDNPFAKSEVLNIGKEFSWNIDKQLVLATKSASDQKGSYYHLQYDNKQLKLIISSDAKGVVAKKFSQLEIEDVTIDGKRIPLFKWCLNNQQRHDRFLQQGLAVKKNVCTIDGNAGSFIMSLNKETLLSLQKGKTLSVKLSPFRTPLELNYDISDFKDMYLLLNAKVEPVAIVAPPKPALKEINKNCWAVPPAKYNSIKPVEYGCDDVAAKKESETRVINLVKQEKAKLQKSAAIAAATAAEKAAERARQHKLLEQRKQEALAEKRKQEEKLQLEAAAIAASEVKQAQLNDEITQKMLKLCEKSWRKGEHRCYCQKYIEHAPASIQASASCE
ncbi:MAG: hypothetical protein QNL62_07100, partial [Gammaproteobacteria bacterium]|nr:hypothetical protein [Gammaproteobacteria bacterium]